MSKSNLLQFALKFKKPFPRNRFPLIRTNKAINHFIRRKAHRALRVRRALQANL